MNVSSAFDRFRPFTFHLVDNPRWADAGHTQIILDVVFDHIVLMGVAEGAVEFRADPNDVEEHGRELYARAAAGEFGPVAAYKET